MDDTTPHPSLPSQQRRSRARQPGRRRSLSAHADRYIRGFLVAWTAILTLLIILAYLSAKDIRVLYGGTIVAIAVMFVYAYYFRR